MKASKERELVLAIAPSPRGIAFTLFDAPLSPVDWGMKVVLGKIKNALALEAAKKLLELHEPDIVVLEDVWALGSRRGARLRRLQSLITNHTEGQHIEVHHYSRLQIRACFKATGAVTRYEIAQAIAAHIHAFEHRLPPVRQIWEAEDKRMSLFDAAALAMTFYCQGGNQDIDFERLAA